MQYTYLGQSGLRVSRLCLGTMNFGVDTDEKEAFRILDAALDAGINFIDTANIYGWGENSGRTEEIIGKWFSQGGGRRERTVLATKVYGDMNDDHDGPNREAGLSAYKIRRHLEGSLRRLQTDHIELYQMHHVDRNVHWNELWSAFETAVSQGKIGYVGSSNFAGWDIAVAQGEAKARGILGLVSEQHKYNLLCRLPELEVLPASKALGLGVIPWSPLDGGCLRAITAGIMADAAVETPSVWTSIARSWANMASFAMSWVSLRISYRSHGCWRIRRLRLRLLGCARWSSSSARFVR